MSKTLDLPKGKLIKSADEKRPVSVCIGLTAYRVIEQKTVQSLFNTMGRLPYSFGMITHTSANVWQGRNKIVEHYLESGADFLVFVDADMVFTAEDMDKLIKAGIDNPDAGVIAGFYVSRDENLRPLIGWTDEDGTLLPHQEQIDLLTASRGKMVEANMLPTGFMLVRRSVFETLENPWFITDQRIMDDGEIRFYSSDNVFTQKCSKAGIKTYGHFGIELGHIGNFVYHPAQLWPQLESFNAQSARLAAKADFGSRFGYNSEEYWNSLYSYEHAIQMERRYPALHQAVVAGIQPDWRVIDVGSGPGVLAQQIQTVTDDVHCLDLSSRAVEYCEAKGLSASQWDLVNDPVPTNMHGSADCVVCTEVLEHLEDPQAAIKKLYSLLKPGGIIIVTVPDDRLPPEVEPEHFQAFTAVKFASLFKPFDEVFVEPIAGYLMGCGMKPAKPKRK
jgi:2-polyprenyl-3-methyl-5-hydroxy-6-metoxy-1,4-benzoquinol methylase